MDKRFDYGMKVRGTEISAIGLRRWITTIDGECPRCGSHSLIKYVDSDVTIGCLGCGWKENESIDHSIQKAIDDLKRTLERIKRKRMELEDINTEIGRYREHVDNS